MRAQQGGTGATILLMRRILAALILALGILPLAASTASAAVATQFENRTSGLRSGSNNLVGIDPWLSEEVVRGKVARLRTRVR